MLLIPQINSIGNLFLNAYSFSSAEINAVAIVISNSDIKVTVTELPIDRTGRFGIQFMILSADIYKLERTLNLKFEGNEDSTVIKMGEHWLHFDGRSSKSYKCRRIDPPPASCETIYASDDKEATVVCGLVASKNNWLGGDAKPGHC